MPKIDPRNSFMTAEAFLQACALVDKAVRRGEFVTVGVVATLEAFTLELHLKCLLLLEEGLPKRGHDTFRLFKYLSPTTQAELIQAFAQYIAQYPEFLAEGKQRNLPCDLESLLIRGRHAFEVFRYGHENVGKSKTIWALKGLIVVIRERILTAKPEWKTALSDIFIEALNHIPRPSKGRTRRCITS